MTPRTGLAVLLLAALAAGCASQPARFYTLTGAAPVTAAAGPSVAVGPVTIPAVVDRPEMVVTIAPNEVWPDEFNRWAGPLGEAISLALAQDLAAELRTPRVTLAAATAADPEYRVAVEVQRFESVPGSHALLDAAWTVRRVRDGTARSGRTTAREATAGASYDALAAAHSRALSQLARDTAAALSSLPPAPVPAAPTTAR
ncbi:MAG: PqiC family protein [Burkholderiales bacterium]